MSSKTLAQIAKEKAYNFILNQPKDCAELVPDVMSTETGKEILNEVILAVSTAADNGEYSTTVDEFSVYEKVFNSFIFHPYINQKLVQKEVIRFLRSFLTENGFSIKVQDRHTIEVSWNDETL